MNSVKDLIKKYIKMTYYYQRKQSHQYFLEREQQFKYLEDDEINNKHRFVRNTFNKTVQINSMLRKIKISIRDDARFQNWIDTGLYVGRLNTMTDNVPPFYPVILENSLKELKEKYKEQDSKYYKDQYSILEGIENYIYRIINEIDFHIGRAENPEKLIVSRNYFERMLNSSAESLEEALQRILFWSSLFWQSQHLLVGLGRLDKILFKYLSNCPNVIDILVDFCKEIHRYYAFKSGPTSLGDTGQIIILGGIEEDGSYYANSLTYDFIRVMKICHLPDPKVLLRVSRKMPEDLLILALKCIQTGIGCPLLANDDIIIPALMDFGYKKADAHDYVTSACWEPLVYGKSLEKNNLKIINYAEPLSDIFAQNELKGIDSFESLKDAYLNKLTSYMSKIIEDLDGIKWEKDPLLSLLTLDCYTKGVDIAEGGARYNDYGILSVGMSNVINSLFNIKKFVFDEKKYDIDYIRIAVTHNYVGYQDLLNELKKEGYYGSDDISVIATVNDILDVTEKACCNYRNRFGGRVKFGLSASNYVEIAKGTKATPDGRMDNEPLRTHITATGKITYTELLNFGSKINYSGFKANGNVIDFFVTPILFEKQFHKLVLLFKNAIANGFFEMQMNVVSSAILCDAKENPEKYPDLIVRVWGFSAYFKDLPDEYQNVLIERALQNESVA